MISADLFPEVRAPEEQADGDQRFTLRETDAWCRVKAGVEAWDLDVAACEESHLAERYFTKADNGLVRPWFGRVFVNPPFSDIEPWVAKAWREMESAPGPSVIAMLLPASRTEQPFWAKHVEPWRDRGPYLVHGIELTTHFLPGRTRFGMPGNRDGVGVGSPPFGCVCLVWRRTA